MMNVTKEDRIIFNKLTRLWQCNQIQKVSRRDFQLFSDEMKECECSVKAKW